MLYLVRHGTTQFNSYTLEHSSGERLRGWLSIPLDENGIRQAQEAGKILQKLGIVHLYSSPLTRAMQTSESLGIELPTIKSDGLTPWNVGNIAGRLISEAIPLMEYYSAHSTEVVPEGECFNEFLDRWRTSLFFFIEESKTRTIALVTHSRNLYSLDHLLTNGDKPITFNGKPLPGGIVKLDPMTLTTTIIL